MTSTELLKTEELPKTKLSSRILFWTFFVIVTVLVIYAVIAAFGNVLGVVEIAETLGVGLSMKGYVWAGLSILMPPIFFIIALLLGFGKTLSQKSVLLFLAVTLSSVWALNILHFIGISGLVDV